MRNLEKVREKERRRHPNRKRAHGLTPNEMKIRLETLQGGKCGLCRLPISGRIAHGDHDHKTGRFRAVLCNNCNTGIGLLNDNAALCRAAAEYLDYHEKLQELL